MDFINKAKERFDKYKTVFCMGMDPVIERIPGSDMSKIERSLTDFYFSLIDAFNEKALAVKPNIAFFEQYGIDGLKALKSIIQRSQKYGLPVILDAKRGDIGSTAKAYAIAAFDELGADAITLSPYLGEDSLEPFFRYADKGFFVLARTSNKGGSDLQSLKLDGGKELYLRVAELITAWNKKYSHGIGAVAGATNPSELETIAKMFFAEGALPLLIPGVGKQGGDLEDIINILKKYDYPLHKVFINSSSKVNYAYLDHPGMSPLDAASLEIQKMMLQ